MTITLKRTVFGDAVCRVINVISFSETDLFQMTYGTAVISIQKPKYKS